MENSENSETSSDLTIETEKQENVKIENHQESEKNGQLEVEKSEIQQEPEKNGQLDSEKIENEQEPKKENEKSLEKDYIEMVFALESEKQTLIEESRAKIGQLKKELEDVQAENEKLKRKNAQLEQNLVQKEALGVGSDASKAKKEQCDVLTKAKTLLFEKTKVCKQQEQHVDVLKNQVDSIKEVLAVTKEMLNLRNIENDHLQSRLEAIELRFKAEKDRQSLLERKLDISKKMYDELRKEYDYQSKLHKEFKAAYEQKFKIMSLSSNTESQKG